MNLRVGVIGIGYFGKHYVRLLQEMEGVELAGIAARSGADKLNLPSSVAQYSDASMLLQDADIDCVVIATPPSTHAALAIAALENGKHVLLEKPMASSLVEAQAIADAVKKSGRTFMVGHQYCYNDYIGYLKKELEKKTLGGVRFLIAEHFYPGPIRLDIGCFWETATHELAMIDYLFPGAKVVKIAGKMVDMSGSGRDDFASALIAYDNGLMVSITTSWFMPQKVRRMVITGQNGMARFDESQEHPLEIYMQQYPVSESPESHTSHFFEIADEKKIAPPIHISEPLRNQLKHFIACITEKKVPITDIEHAMRVTRMLDSVSAAMRT